MGAIWQDSRYALRGIARKPLLSLAVLLALVAGIGLNAAVFALLNDFWFRAPVERDPGGFIQAVPSYSGWFETENQFHGFTVNDYEAIRTRTKSLQSVAGFSGAGSAKLDNDLAEAGLSLVTCNFFDVYEWTPVSGRLFLPQECSTPGSAPVVVISEALWRTRYGADPRIVGRIVRINQQPFTVVGVVRFRSPLWMKGDLCVPYTMQPLFYRGYDGFKEHQDYPWLSVFGRLKPGYSQSDAQAEIRLIQSQQDQQIPGRKTLVQVTNGSMFQNPQARLFGFVIVPLVMGPMVLILLVACTNVTMLLLSRAAARRGEIAIRIALGAGRARLLRMLATEGAIIAAAAGAVSLYFAHVLPGLLEAFLIPRAANRAMEPDWRVFAYLAGVTLIAACIAGLAPAKASLKVDLLTSLKGQEGAATAPSRTHNILLIAQMAMSFVLVAAGVLFVHLQRSVTSMDPGFETRKVLVVPLAVSMPPYTQESAAIFYRAVRERVRELPGVRSASYTDVVPFSGEVDEIRLPGEPAGERPVVVEHVSTDFFTTLGISIVRGRAFQDFDATATGDMGVAIISQALAAAFWKEQEPLGKVVSLPDNTRLLVVGVARNLLSSDFDVPDGPRLYVLQNPQAPMGSLMVRFDSETRSLAPAIAHTIQGLDTTQLVSPRTVRSLMEEEAERIRPLMDLILMMALLTLLLAVSGVYGAVAFAMSQRTREIGIRTALGATKSQILGSVLLSGIRQIAIGLCVGLLLALPAAFAFRQLLRSSSLFDWSTYFVAGLVLALAALCAYYIPARRAMQVDPIQALRYE
jgi:predicted permease